MISQIPNIEIFIKSVRVLFVYLLPKQSDWLTMKPWGENLNRTY